MAVILLRPIECYGDDDSDLRKNRQGSRASFEFSRATRGAKPPVKRTPQRSPLALVPTSPTEKAESTHGQRNTKVRPGTE
jgi:hypothetical protein